MWTKLDKAVGANQSDQGTCVWCLTHAVCRDHSVAASKQVIGINPVVESPRIDSHRRLGGVSSEHRLTRF